MSSFMKICLVGADLFHANEQMNRRTRGITKLIVAFRSFVNAPKADRNYTHTSGLLRIM